MTHQNLQTNGASLEDCHTNFFALTDLCGIKWRKFVNGERPNASSDPLQDPILRSYSRCMQADILCVWRRVQSTKQDISDPNVLSFEINTSKIHPPLSLAAAKELWIFWYGEEPDLTKLVDAELLKFAGTQALWNGTWERGLTYECRSLLFKALHNLMERFVLTKDIVRFGKWFVQPCTANDHSLNDSFQHISFSFTFFVHGDTVCASIDLREHPAVRPITNEHLVEAAAAFTIVSSSLSDEQNSASSHEEDECGDVKRSGNIPSPKLREVILAPFGIAATLTGNSYIASDPMAEKILDDWASFFPLCNKENLNVPPVVEVVSGGHRMYHPSIYVLVTDLDHSGGVQSKNYQTNTLEQKTFKDITLAPIPNNANFKFSVNLKSKAMEIKSPIKNSSTYSILTKSTYSQKVNTYYDSLTSGFTYSSLNTHSPPQAANEMPERVWQDCIKNSSKVRNSRSLVAANLCNSEEECGVSSRAKITAEASDQAQNCQGQTWDWNFQNPLQKAACICTKNIGSENSTPQGYATKNAIRDLMHGFSMTSPDTPTDSPQSNLVLSHLQHTTDQLSHTSPRPQTSTLNIQEPFTPLDHLIERNTPPEPTPSDQHEIKSITAFPYIQPTSSMELPPSVEPQRSDRIDLDSGHQPSVDRYSPTKNRQTHSISTSHNCVGKISVKKFDVHQSFNSDTKSDCGVSHILTRENNQSLQRPSAIDAVNGFLKLYKPPKIHIKDNERFANDDYLKLEALYDFSIQDAWVNHPIKRFKSSDVDKKPRTQRIKNLYDGHAHFKPLTPSPAISYGSQLLPSYSTNTESALISNEGTLSENNSSICLLASGNVAKEKPCDSPRYFQGIDLKNDILTGNASPCKELKVSSGGNLFTAEGLNPSLNDLEQLFETSSNDECGSVQIHTPPDSNNPPAGCISTKNIEEIKQTTTVVSTMPTTLVANNLAGSKAMVVLQNCSTNMNCNQNLGASAVQPEDLTKMFPTPPSHDQNHQSSSPCQIDIQMTDVSVITTSLKTNNETGLGVGVFTKVKEEYSVELGSPVDEPIEDWTYVYKPPQQAKFVGSSKYAPLHNLPSQALPSITVPDFHMYEPSWKTQKPRTIVSQQHQHMHHRFQQNGQQHLNSILSTTTRTPLQQSRNTILPLLSSMESNNAPSSPNSNCNLLLNQLNCPQAALTNSQGNTSAVPHVMHRTGMSPISPIATSVSFPRENPMMQTQRQTPIHPPPPYEMAIASPATSTSSYLNKPYNSQEPHPQTPQSIGVSTLTGGTHLAAGNFPTAEQNSSFTLELPEVNSLIVNILLYDTALNVFRDHNFDSSTVCVCNADSQKVGNIRGADSGVYVPLPGSTFNPITVHSPTNRGLNARASTWLLSAFANGGSGGIALDSPASLPGAIFGNVGSNTTSSGTSANNQHVTGYIDDDPVDCTCGFSAVMNRRLAHRAGLFYEDEMEITGIAEDPKRHRKPTLLSIVTNLSSALGTQTVKSNNALVIVNSEKSSVYLDQQAHAIFNLLLDQCSIIQTSSSSIHRALQRYRRRLIKHKGPQINYALANVLEFIDANDIISLAFQQARVAFDSNQIDINEFSQHHQLSPLLYKGSCKKNSVLFDGKLSVHKWPFIPAGFSRNNKDIVRTMNSIQPMLQNAFHKKSGSAAGSKDATYTVSGPLTWRQFHRLAGRASGQCEPQPIPSVIVGHDKDWISVAPLALPYWDKFLLEPYSYARDIVYLIMCPDEESLVTKIKTYFKELSNTYEMCKLGRHTPIKGWDGILTVDSRTCNENTNIPKTDWLRISDDITLAEKIGLYANTFQNVLVPYLNRVPGDKTLLNPPEYQNGTSILNSRERGTASPAISIINNASTSANGKNSTGESDKMHKSPKLENNLSDQAVDNNCSESKNDGKPDNKPAIVLGDPLGMGEAMEDVNPPAIVLYVVEPFTFGCDLPELERLACIALLRCYSELLKNIPDSVKSNINIQIISLESIIELGSTRDRKKFSDEIKCLALSIFSQCRRHLVHAQSVKSLTGFGTAANMEVFLKSKDDKNRQAYKMYTPPYILAPVHEKNDKTDFTRISSGNRLLNEQKYSVLYCNYCMSEDQCWLLATATDERGELLEKICINIDVPNRTRRCKVPARRIGLKKLMDFIMGLISQTTQPWRLVIGRIGRIGHGELKSWSYLLSKQSLQKISKQLKDICKQCTLTYPPSILSACLVTLEPDAKLRVMPDQFTPDERFSQISMQNPLSTPQDVTCTHILVFPTSAVCLSFTRQFQNEPQVDLDNDFLNFEECEDENEGFADADLMDGLLDWEQQLGGRLSNHGSPDRLEDHRSWQSTGCNNFNTNPQQDMEEVGSINQQPLAVGYMVSTAPTGRMPAWFWAACPHLEDVCPVFLKTALHLHVPNIQATDDILNSTNTHTSATDHQLDSILTADVLRYVLEGYNALSWLALDSNTHDRLSCLPINVQILMDLYYMIAAIA